MQKRWHYLYVILYPSLGYKCYYGSRVTKTHPADDVAYFGSSVTFAHYNDVTSHEYQADALKVILHAEYVWRSRKSAEKLNTAEAELIRTALNEAELGPAICLNRNVSGQIYLTPAERKIAVARSVAAGSGFSNMSVAELKKHASDGGLKAARLKKGVHGMSAAALKKSRRLGASRSAEKLAKTYNFRDPAGKSVTIHNLAAFCRQCGLDACNMRKLHRGTAKSCKGWTKP